MIKIVIIADDFTGVLDTGVQFSKLGIPTLVTTDTELDFLSISGDIQVLAIDAETRHASPAAAYNRVYKLAQKAIKSGIPHIYKKTDSTLRGNIGSELVALLDAANQTQLVFAPAFPKNRRVTRRGIQYCGDTEIHKTAFAIDPLNPITTSNIKDILQSQTDISIQLSSVDAYETVISTTPTDKTICVFDASTDEDFHRLGNLMKDYNKSALMAGSAGLAAILPSVIDFSPVQKKQVLHGEFPLVIVGSVNQTSLNQIQDARKNGFPVIALTPEQRLNPAYFDSAGSDAFMQTVKQTLSQNGKIVIGTICDRKQMEDTSAYAKLLNIPEEEIPSRIVNNIGRFVRKVLDSEITNTFVIFGGDTLLGVLNSIHYHGIIPVAEIFPGVVLSQIQYKNKNLLLATKAGGFGDNDAITRICSYLLCRQISP